MLCSFIPVLPMRLQWLHVSFKSWDYLKRIHTFFCKIFSTYMLCIIDIVHATTLCSLSRFQKVVFVRALSTRHIIRAEMLVRNVVVNQTMTIIKGASLRRTALVSTWIHFIRAIATIVPHMLHAFVPIKNSEFKYQTPLKIAQHWQIRIRNRTHLVLAPIDLEKIVLANIIQTQGWTSAFAGIEIQARKYLRSNADRNYTKNVKMIGIASRTSNCTAIAQTMWTDLKCSRSHPQS